MDGHSLYLCVGLRLRRDHHSLIQQIRRRPREVSLFFVLALSLFLSFSLSITLCLSYPLSLYLLFLSSILYNFISLSSFQNLSSNLCLFPLSLYPSLFLSLMFSLCSISSSVLLYISMFFLYLYFSHFSSFSLSPNNP